MQRRKFIHLTALGTGFACYSASELFGGLNGELYPELKKHKIVKSELVKYEYHWPRHVGKNSRKGDHGQYHKSDALRLTTDQGAMGWALCSNRVKEQVPQLEGNLAFGAHIP